MRLRSLAVLAGALLLAGPPAAQTIAPVGTAATLDVATWNLEFFGRPDMGPTNEPLQFRNVLAVLRQGGVDVWALQEVTSPATAQRLFDSLAVSGLTGVLGPQVSSNPTFDQRLAFVYDPAVVQPVQIGPVLTGSAHFFGGRAPVQLRADVTVGGVTREVRFLTVHAKAGGSLDDYNDRVSGSAALKNYVDNLRALGAPVVVLGDLNDEIGTSTAGGRVSPYQNFRADAAGYFLATLALDQGNIPTYCGNNTACTSGSTLDHVFLTSDLADAHRATGRYVALLDAFDAHGGEFVATTSDHLPVWSRLELTTTPAEPAAPHRALALAPPAPNPTAGSATLAYTLERAADVRLEVFDALGRRVALLAEGAHPAGPHRATLDAALAPGLYLVRLSAGGEAVTQRLVRR